MLKDNLKKLNYKILWQQLARHLINKKPFKHRDEGKMDQRFLEIYQQFVDQYGSHEKAAKKLYYHDEFTHLLKLFFGSSKKRIPV